MKKDLEIYTKEIDINRLAPKDSVNLIFLNELGVWNIPKNIEDVIKSNAYFKNKPQQLYFTTSDEIQDGDRYLYWNIGGTDFSYAICVEGRLPKCSRAKLVAAYPEIEGIPVPTIGFLNDYVLFMNNNKHEAKNCWGNCKSTAKDVCILCNSDELVSLDSSKFTIEYIDIDTPLLTF